jgi:hypothetical protein
VGSHDGREYSVCDVDRACFAEPAVSANSNCFAITPEQRELTECAAVLQLRTANDDGGLMGCDAPCDARLMLKVREDEHRQSRGTSPLL